MSAGGKGDGRSRRKFSPRFYIIVVLFIIVLPPAGYLLSNWYTTKKKWTEDCFRRPLRDLTLPEREGVIDGEDFALAFSSDGRRALCGGHWWFEEEEEEEERVRFFLWDFDEEKPARKLKFLAREGASEREIFSLVVSPDGRRALSGGRWLDGEDNTRAEVFLWDLDEGRLIRELDLPEREGEDEHLVLSAAISPDGRRALTGSLWELDEAAEDAAKEPAGFSLWDLEEGRLIRELVLPAREGRRAHWAHAVAFSPDGTRALSGSSWMDAAEIQRGELLLWDIEGGRLVREFEFPAREGVSGRLVSSVAVSPNGRRALSGGARQEVSGVGHAELFLWDLDGGALVREFEFPKREGMFWRDVLSVALSPDGRRALSGGSWRSVGGIEHVEFLLWDLDGGKLIREFKLPEREGVSGRAVSSVAFSADGKRALCGGRWEDDEGDNRAEILLWQLPDELGFRLLGTQDE